MTRHAEATHVRITLHHDSISGKLNLNIQDDGKGMLNPNETHHGFGLIGMRERVAALHGDMQLLSETDGGLQIMVELPVESSAA